MQNSDPTGVGASVFLPAVTASELVQVRAGGAPERPPGVNPGVSVSPTERFGQYQPLQFEE